MGGLAPVYPPLIRPDLRQRLVEPLGDAMAGALAYARRSVAP